MIITDSNRQDNQPDRVNPICQNGTKRISEALTSDLAFTIIGERKVTLLRPEVIMMNNIIRNIAIVSLSRGIIGEPDVQFEVEIGLRRLKEY